MSLAELATAVLPEADKPELVSEAAIAEKGHVNRLHEQETDLNTVIFQNRDGTKTLYYFAEPVKYVDETGQIRDKSNCLVEVTDPLYAADYGYVNGSNDIQTYFPKSLDTGSGLLLCNGNTAIELQPLSSLGTLEANPRDTAMLAGGKAMAEANGEQAQPVLITVESPAKAAAADLLTSETIQYSHVFGENTALQYAPTYNGFKEDIILTQYDGVNEFTFRLNTNGLTMACEDGQYYLVDPLTGERLIHIGELFVYDSRDVGSSDEADTAVGNEEKQASAAQEEVENPDIPVPEDSAEPFYNHHYVVETVVADEEYRITVVVDEDYLRAPDTVYPVIVDPSFSFNKSASAIQDAILYNGASARNTAHGSNWDHYIGYYNSTYGVGRLLVKFPGLTNSALFKSLDASQISSASFNVWQYRVSTAPTNIRAYLYNGSAWTESTIRCTTASWNGYTSLSGMDNVSVTSRAWYSFNIKPAVLKWKDGTHDAAKGLMIRNLNESNSGCYKVFNSTEWGSSQNSSQMPYVTLSWNANTPSGITNNSVYYFQNVCSGKYLDIQNNGTSNNTPTIQNSLSYKPSQRFKLVRDSSGYYRIHAQNTTAKRVLLLNTSNQVVLSDDCTNDRALWRIKDEGGGCYSFINKANESTSAYAMSNMGSNSSGAQVKGETYTNATRLRWRLKKAVTSISLNKASEKVAIGHTISLSATINPSDGISTAVTWSSSDSRIATVSASGVVTGISNGTVRITAKAVGDSSKTAECIVSVGLYVTNVRISRTNDEFDTVFYVTTFSDGSKTFQARDAEGNVSQIFDVGSSAKDVLYNALEWWNDYYINGNHDRSQPPQEYNYIALACTGVYQNIVLKSSNPSIYENPDPSVTGRESMTEEFYGLWAYFTLYEAQKAQYQYYVNIISSSMATAMSMAAIQYQTIISAKAYGISADEVRIINSYEYDTALDAAYRIEYGLRDTSYSSLKTMSASEVNTILGYSNPPYKAGTPAAKFTLARPAQYVRVYEPTGTGDGIARGRWIMRLEDVQGLTPAQIRDKFALPSIPTYICDVNIPAGTQLHTGIVAPVNGWGNGGGLQYDIIYDGYIPNDWFTNGRPLS